MKSQDRWYVALPLEQIEVTATAWKCAQKWVNGITRQETIAHRRSARPGNSGVKLQFPSWKPQREVDTQTVAELLRLVG
jgi:hypothetical protein